MHDKVDLNSIKVRYINFFTALLLFSFAMEELWILSVSVWFEKHNALSQSNLCCLLLSFPNLDKYKAVSLEKVLVEFAGHEFEWIKSVI